MILPFSTPSGATVISMQSLGGAKHKLHFARSERRVSFHGRHAWRRPHGRDFDSSKWPPAFPGSTAGNSCGYCQAGTFMTTAALLAKNSTPMDSDVYEVFARHVCRCITCQRIRRAVQQAAVKHPSAETAPPTPTAAGGAR